MFSRRTLKQSLSALRGGLAAAAALALVAGTIGVPLPAGRPKDRSTAFPCMDRACGCHDAADCKAHCCCFSSEEKLAWAAEHGVDARPFVDEAEATYLAAKDNAACCQKLPATCCSSAGNGIDAPPCAAHMQESEDHPAGLDGSLSISAYRQCSGFGSLWSVLNAALVPPKCAEYEFDWLVIGRVHQQNSLAAFLSFSPPTPPPRT